MTRNARRAGPTLRLPPRLVEALSRLEGGPLDGGPVVRRIAAGVARLNRGLTRERAGFGAYLRDPELRAAYRAYYLATNAPKLFPVLDRLAAQGRLPAGGGRALEVGCGPGTGVAGLAIWAAERGETWHLTATDALREATQAAAALFAALAFPLETAVLDLRTPPVTPAPATDVAGPFDLILCLNVVNELPPAGDAALLDRMRGWLAPRGCLIVLEPASAAESRRVLALRDRAVATGWHVLAPCPAAGPCPALASADGWCHGEWHFERPAYLQAVDRATGLRREVLKATWFVLSPAAGEPSASAPTPGAGRLLARVMGARTDAKGRSELEVCADGALRRLELQTRDRTPENADFFDLSRHDLALIEGPGAQNPGTRRLGADDAVTRLEEVE